MGIMLESFLQPGRQEPGDPATLVYGQSVTDACIDVEATAEVLRGLAAAVRRAGPSRRPRAAAGTRRRARVLTGEVRQGPGMAPLRVQTASSIEGAAPCSAGRAWMTCPETGAPRSSPSACSTACTAVTSASWAGPPRPRPGWTCPWS